MTLRGRYVENADLSKTNWFQVGGKADILFKPEDTADLAEFIRAKPQEVPLTVIGVGSNLLVRDGGIRGAVIRLGRSFAEVKVSGLEIEAGGAALDHNVALYAAENGITGLEFLSGIPGTIGGAVAMNAGAYGRDFASIAVKAEIVGLNGETSVIPVSGLGLEYRKCKYLRENSGIVTKAWMKGEHGEPATIKAAIEKIKQDREATQPLRSKTGGSTFKNPPGQKAWELIDQAGCRGLRLGGAMVSEKHCNFLINTGGANATDIENLGEEVKRRVWEASGVELEWEIKIIGEPRQA